MRALMVFLLLLVTLPARAEDSVVGVWKLVSVMYEDQETKQMSPVLGDAPRGYQIATADGRWLALVTANGRPVPKTRSEEHTSELQSH